MSTPPTTSEREPVKVIADILQAELDLQDDALILENEKAFIPERPGLFVCLDYIGGRQIGAANYLEDDGHAGFNEVQEAVWLHMVQVELQSVDRSATARKEEIGMALGSIRSRQAQERYAMQIARLVGPPTNTSRLEGVKIINAWAFTVNATAIHRKVRVNADSFTAFPGQLVTDPGPAQPLDFNPTQLPMLPAN